MQISVTEAKGQLTELVRRAEAGAGAARSQDFLYDGDGLPKGSWSTPPR